MNTTFDAKHINIIDTKTDKTKTIKRTRAYRDGEVEELFGISLYNRCNLVTSQEEAKLIVSDLTLIAKTYGQQCIGLAAPQIGYDKRIFIVKIKNSFVPFVNPSIVQRLGGYKSMYERCLSFPGKSVKLRRHKKIKIITYSDSFERFDMKFDGMTARIIQHEYDHLLGICI